MALCDRVPDVPVTVIVYDPVGVVVVVEIVRVLVKVGFPLVGFSEVVGPFVTDGETEDDRLTDCVVPLMRETVTVEVVLLPCPTEPLEGLRLTPKSKVPEETKAPS